MNRNGASKTCKNIHRNGEMSRKNSINITYLASSDCQSNHANPFLRGGAPGAPPPRRPRLDPRRDHFITNHIVTFQ